MADGKLVIDPGEDRSKKFVQAVEQITFGGDFAREIEQGFVRHGAGGFGIAGRRARTDGNYRVLICKHRPCGSRRCAWSACSARKDGRLVTKHQHRHRNARTLERRHVWPHVDTAVKPQAFGHYDGDALVLGYKAPDLFITQVPGPTHRRSTQTCVCKSIPGAISVNFSPSSCNSKTAAP